MKAENNLLEVAIAGGLIGAALEALVSGDKKNSGLGALAGAVIAASLRANQEASKTNVPVVIEENNNLYEVSPDGSKKLIKKLEKNSKPIPKKFTLN
jgi:Ran GTPase-activating protein (RanGAP) involved in mRNA processing and transport